MQIVWFKRDLRVHDHPALTLAAQHGTLLPLYIVEPEFWRQPDVSYRHYLFLRDCLAELDAELQKLGQGLIIKVGDAVDVLQWARCHYPIHGLWSHQETWNGWTYARDRRVKAWARAHAIPWHEPVQHGVTRRLEDRNGWAARWYAHMKKLAMQPPRCLQAVGAVSTPLPAPEELGLRDDGCTVLQRGGRNAALTLLHGFLHERGEGYTGEMSSPLTAYDSCSRLSAHLAFGTLSMREVLQAAEERNREVSSRPPGIRGKWPSTLQSFRSRLRWHCHFIQKLEDEPRIEFENMHSAYDGLREGDFNPSYFEAWKAGKTGYPMVDACMRALTATGWLNFRMRAMLMSFASYHLWLHWREPALHLARLFTDYEPGIHYSQAQMQSGTTGINSVRIYNPIKQGVDHDPEGRFIRRWIPELADMPREHIHTPWELPAGMKSYPMPIVDEKTTRKSAADRIHGLRKQARHKQEARGIVRKHGSRKSGLPRTAGRRTVKPRPLSQAKLPL